MSEASKNPLLLVGLAIGGLLLYRATTAPAIPSTLTQRTADYFNPVDLAAAFGRFVVGMTKGVPTTAPAGIFATQGAPTPGSVESGLAGWKNYSGSAAQGTLTDTGDPYSTWSGPVDSAVRDSNARSPQVDQVATAPVYDPALDFANNPTAWFGLGP